jgi:hypothetical protein
MSDYSNALAELAVGLREAAQHRGSDDRRAAGLALGAVLNFLFDALPELTKQELHMPLADLLAALETLSYGRVSPMLQPTWAGNSPPFGATFRKAKGYAVFAVQDLVDQGDKVKPASDAVAKTWNETLADPKKTAGATIRSWFYRSPGLPDDDPERMVIAALQQGCAQHPEMRTFNRADILALLSANLIALGTKTIVEQG